MRNKSQLEQDLDAYARGRIKKAMWELEDELEEMLEQCDFSRERIEALLHKIKEV